MHCSRQLVSDEVLNTGERGDLHNVTGVPEGVVQRSQLRTVRRVGNFGDEHGRCVCCECDTEADQETGYSISGCFSKAGIPDLPSGDEHAQVTCASLNADTAYHDSRADPNCESSS